MRKDYSAKLKILMVSYEATQFFKRGGLGGVMRTLPMALVKDGIDAYAVIPYYDSVRSQYSSKQIGEFSLRFDNREQKVTIYKNYYSCTKIPIYFLCNKAIKN